MALAKALPARSTTSDSECQNWCDFFGGSHDVMIQMPNDYVSCLMLSEERSSKKNSGDLQIAWTYEFQYVPKTGP